MSDFKDKMHQNRFVSWGSAPGRPRWGSLEGSPNFQAGTGLLLRKGQGCRDGKGEKRQGKEREGSRGKEVEGTPVCIFKFSLE